MSTSNQAQEIAREAIAFEQVRTGLKPKAVRMVLTDETLVITLQGGLSPAEQAMARHPEGAAQLQECHRHLFARSCDRLMQAIRRITGVEVCEASAEIELVTGTVVHVFTTGSIVQVVHLAGCRPTQTWTEPWRAESSSPRP